jgi:hypothetical protein
VTRLKNVGTFLLGFLVLWSVLYLLANFSMRQSVALALLTQYAVYGFGAMTPRPDIVFVPHRILIRPIWHRILLDLELTATDAEYDSLCQTFNSLPHEQYNVFRDGVCFTVLDSEQFGQRTLIYSDDHHTFVSEVDFERSLAPPLATSDRPEFEFQTFSPRLFVDGGVGGYVLGLIVDQWWWEKRKESITSKTGRLDVREIFDTGMMRLTLANIPKGELTSYWKGVKPNLKRDDAWKKRRDEDRAKFEWVADNFLETSVDTFLKHKYFDVRHYAI